MFSILSKVGIYAVLRLWLLLFGEGPGSAGFGGAWLLFGGMADARLRLIGGAGLAGTWRGSPATACWCPRERC